MSKRWVGLMVALIGSGLTGVALAQQPGFDPREHHEFAGTASEVLVLGTPHLSGLPAQFQTNSLSLLLDRLAAWKPTIITIENLSGPQCEMLLHYKPLYEDAYDSYCSDPTVAERATGLTVAAATLEMEQRLSAWPPDPPPSQRRHLAAVMLAAGDRASAFVQWLRLPLSERHAGDELDEALVTQLTKFGASRNESFAIASVLAARLGLERVYPVDDHTADATISNLGKPFEEATARIWKGAGPRLAAIKAEEAKLGSPEATLGYYRYHNRPQTAEDAFTYDFGAALKDQTTEQFGRRYVGWWETRNLRMVANIRAALAPQPGARLLAVVGSSHKGYFEAYLAMMHDITLADTEEVLK